MVSPAYFDKDILLFREITNEKTGKDGTYLKSVRYDVFPRFHLAQKRIHIFFGKNWSLQLHKSYYYIVVWLEVNSKEME